MQRPHDQRIIEEAARSISYFAASGWIIVGITNQAGVVSGKKSLQSCIKEQKYTLVLLPEMAEIYFCPDFEGKKCVSVTHRQVYHYSQHKYSGKFRKPNAGMLNLVIDKYQPDKILMIGDQPEDREAAKIIGVKFQQAQNWRQTYNNADF